MIFKFTFDTLHDSLRVVEKCKQWRLTRAGLVIVGHDTDIFYETKDVCNLSSSTVTVIHEDEMESIKRSKWANR